MSKLNLTEEQLMKQIFITETLQKDLQDSRKLNAIKTGEARIVAQELAERKSTIDKLREIMINEPKRMYQCQISMKTTEGQISECKKSEDELAKLRIESSKSTSSDLIPMVMSLSDTISKLTLTNEQQALTIAKLTAAIEHLSSSGINEKE